MRVQTTAVAKWVRVGAVLFVALVFTGRPGSVVSADEDRAESRVSDAKTAAVDEIVAWSVDGGGGESFGGGFVLTASVGQYDAGVVHNCGTALAGGLWSGAIDLRLVFCNGFESGDTNGWSSVTGGMP
jgi:hypothetical protein